MKYRIEIVGDLNTTDILADKISKLSEELKVVVLRGDLGAGKTTLTSLIGKKLGVKEVINSPTFTILKQYKLKDKTINHFDFYRLSLDSEDYDFLELIEKDNSLSFIEWYDNFPVILPKESIYVNISILEDDIRKFIIESDYFDLGVLK